MPFREVGRCDWGGRRGAVCSKLEGKCLVFEHASCKVLGDHSTSLPQNREIWFFSYYRVSWKMLEHFIATLKISLKLKAIQLPNILFLQRWDILRGFLEAALKNAPKLSEADISISSHSKRKASNKWHFPPVSFVIQWTVSLCLQDCFPW